jgi:hypothetical protein
VSDDWDFYFCHVDGKPGSIFVDLGIAAEAPIASHPHLAYVRVVMRNPRADGLSSQEEFDALIQLEDRLTGVLTKQGDARYVGRNTSAGTRDFYFYAQAGANWRKRVGAAMTGMSEYRYEAGTRFESDWRTYREFLRPSGEDMERIQNRRVCDNLRKNGDPLTASRAIDHWAYFQDEQSRASFIARVTQLGFEVRSRFSEDETAGRFGVCVSRIDLPSFATIDDITLPLYRAAAEVGGDYDGWETEVCTESDSSD